MCLCMCVCIKLKLFKEKVLSSMFLGDLIRW